MALSKCDHETAITIKSDLKTEETHQIIHPTVWSWRHHENIHSCPTHLSVYLFITLFPTTINSTLSSFLDHKLEQSPITSLLLLFCCCFKQQNKHSLKKSHEKGHLVNAIHFKIKMGKLFKQFLKILSPSPSRGVQTFTDAT